MVTKEGMNSVDRGVQSRSDVAVQGYNGRIPELWAGRDDRLVEQGGKLSGT